MANKQYKLSACACTIKEGATGPGYNGRTDVERIKWAKKRLLTTLEEAFDADPYKYIEHKKREFADGELILHDYTLRICQTKFEE